jgi:hypothetical protein
MSLRTFMFAADALRTEEGVGFQMPPSAVGVPAPAPDVVKRQNEQAMAGFKAQMASVKVKR